MPSVAQQLLGNSAKYRLVGPLGCGGMGTLYLAEQAGPQGFRRMVVLKFIHAEDSADEGYRRRLIDEAELTARIDHPNVGKVFDIDEAEGQMFIVLERVEGVNLDELCKRLQEPLPPWIAAGLMAQACAGLQAAHDLTVDELCIHLIHRDVSRANLMCDTSGRVRVIDFGIARADGRRVVTQSGELRGNLAYMAPEQFTQLEIDPRADIYAAALVFYELCLGRHPFEQRATRMALPRLGSRGIEVGAEVDEVLASCLALDPNQRPGRIEALGEALRRFAGVHGVASPRELAGFFQRSGVSLAPRPVVVVNDARAASDAAAPTGTFVKEIRLPVRDGQECTLADGRRLRLYTTHVVVRRTGATLLALSRVPGLLPGPLSVVCAGEALSLQCERSADVDTRVALYLDADRPGTRQERVLVTHGQEHQILDFGNRRTRALQRLSCTVGQRSAEGAVAVLDHLAVRVAARPDVKLLFVVSVADPHERVVHAECVCVTSNQES